MDYEPLRPKDYFEFGTAWHAAMEAWYNPKLWDEKGGGSEQEARHAFHATNASQHEQLEEFGYGGPDLDEEFNQRHDLGQGMLNYFFGWSRLHDDFEPITVEHEFEVPLGSWCDSSVTLYPKHMGNVDALNDEHPHCNPEWHHDVVYQGRIDGFVRDFGGNYWILEHKTASKEGGTNWLAMDPQTGSYIWAFQKMLNVPILGVIRTVAYKRVAERPRVLKDGSISTDKRQSTTAGLFLEAVQEAYPFQPAHQTIADVPKYLDYHSFLANPDVAPKFVERHQLQRNPDEVENIGFEIAMDAEDMLSNPNITRSVSPMNCNPCAFYGTCLAKWENKDWKIILESEFVKRSAE
jgi:hypothetical protein